MIETFEAFVIGASGPTYTLRLSVRGNAVEVPYAPASPEEHAKLEQALGALGILRVTFDGTRIAGLVDE